MASASFLQITLPDFDRERFSDTFTAATTSSLRNGRHTTQHRCSSTVTNKRSYRGIDIETQLNDALKEAMKQKDQAVLNVIRQVKTEMTKKKASPGFSAEVNDALWLEIIGAYSKSMQKAKDEFQKGGAAAAEQIKELEFEVQYLSKFLPKQKTEDEVREIVKSTIASSGITSKQKAGQLVGMIMKNHKGEIDAALAKRIAEELLA